MPVAVQQAIKFIKIISRWCKMGEILNSKSGTLLRYCIKSGPNSRASENQQTLKADECPYQKYLEHQFYNNEIKHLKNKEKNASLLRMLTPYQFSITLIMTFCRVLLYQIKIVIDTKFVIDKDCTDQTFINKIITISYQFDFLNNMSQGVKKFIGLLKEMHYSSALIQHLINVIESSQQINTMQQLNELIKKETDSVIEYFKQNASELKLIQNKNPLCLQSIRQYFNRVMRGVLKQKYGSIEQVKIKICSASKDLIKIISSSTSTLSEHAQFFWNEQTNRKIIIYSYSKSIIKALKKSAKRLESSMTVYICQSGPLNEGLKAYKDLSIDNIRCELISDNEVGYYMGDVDCVMVGCEVVFENGGVLNRAGTLNLAIIAGQYSKPFYVFAESYKFLRKTYLRQNELPQDLFEDRKLTTSHKIVLADFTPPKYIKLFCTDLGIFTVEGVTNQLSQIFQ